ncbi:hypothetical protein [Desulfosporosinus metallidurans]|uniref:Uncharacterized protein n=1 Tax=Desulfosporosinus metallidurans TaxID=1888891 RepID=A0A1Q8QLL9_9FIRM|nr:hypothetical protein [Desulfosporosinus metallidurans]OLN28239.1 hypothetical protein DSOL_4137 [Desulfosporosinus metallidurans]
MSEFSIKDGLESLNSNELIKLIMNLIQREGQARLHVLEWLEQNCDTNKKASNSNKKSKSPKIHDELLFEYWNNAQSIISEFNCYGGGPEEEEEEVYEWLEKISVLIKEDNITPEAKRRFMEAAFVEYDAGNSGFDDGLMDLFFELCKEKDEWEFLVQKLNRRQSDWRKKLVMRIYRDQLKDDSRYLEERLKNLQYGMDYWDLVQYYIGKRNKKLALEIAQKGIEQGDGRLTELYDYLIDHYSKLQDRDHLESIAKIAMQRKNSESYVLERLFTFYKNGDYEKAKEKLILVYKTTHHKRYFEEYKRMKNYLSESDWEKIEPEIFDEAQNNNIHDYMSICLEKGMKDTVIKTMISPPKNQWGYASFSDFDIFAQKLEKEYPKEILEYYYKKAYRRIPNGDRKTYKEAVKYLGKVKAIYLKHLKDKDGWTHMLNKLLMEFKKRPAFIDEVRKSKL